VNPLLTSMSFSERLRTPNQEIVRADHPATRFELSADLMLKNGFVGKPKASTCCIERQPAQSPRVIGGERFLRLASNQREMVPPPRSLSSQSTIVTPSLA
jgi:hypothetical protein